MPESRRQILTLGMAAGTAALAARYAVADAYPDRPIRVILPYSAGSGADIVTRLTMDSLSSALKQSVVVEDRPGSAGISGTLAAAKAAADGYNLAVIATQQSITPSLYKTLPYDILRDFQPVARLTLHPLVLAVPGSLPVKSVQDLAAYAKARPGTLNYGSTGVGTAIHLAGALFVSVAGLTVTHIAYSSTADALTALSRGDISFMFYGHESLGPLVQAGQLKLLATTGDVRPSWAADLPTVKESGYPTYSLNSWHGVLAPAGTPKDIVGLLDKALAEVLSNPDLKAKFEKVGATPNYLDAEAFTAFFVAEVKRFKNIVEVAGIKPS